MRHPERAARHLPFAAADINKDGKLTKDELANFIWKRFAKPDAQSVTKEELKSFAKQRISLASRLSDLPDGDTSRHAGAAKSETKPTAPQPKPQPKAEPKAEVKPAAGTAAAQMSAPSKPTGPAQPAASKPAQVTTPVNKPTGVSKAETGPSPATAPKNTGPKIGTLTTSGDVKAALFAARR